MVIEFSSSEKELEKVYNQNMSSRKYDTQEIACNLILSFEDGKKMPPKEIFEKVIKKSTYRLLEDIFYYFKKIDGKTLIATPIQVLGADMPGSMLAGGTGEPRFGFAVYTTVIMPKEDIEKMTEDNVRL